MTHTPSCAPDGAPDGTPHAALHHAATVVLLRDSAAGPEVLLLRRHMASPVLGGAHVFAGGKLDDSDLSPPLHARLLESPLRLRQRLNEPDLPLPMAAGLFVAALREVHEECGVFLGAPLAHAHLPSPQIQDTSHPTRAHSWQTHLHTLSEPLHTPAVLPWSRWITPLQMAQGKPRFDTRFFVAQMPSGQSAQHDQHETTESVWLRPAQALARCAQGRMALVAPQIMSLLQLHAHPSVASVLAQAQQQAPPLIEPVVLAGSSPPVLCFPGDPCHPSPQRVWPGPTRVQVQSGRVCLPEGLDAWLATTHSTPVTVKTPGKNGRKAAKNLV